MHARAVFQNLYLWSGLMISYLVGYTYTIWFWPQAYYVTTSPPGQNGHHFADDIFICVFVNEKFCILIKIQLEFVTKDPIKDNPAMVEIMAWCRIGDKPVSDPIHWRIYTALGGDELKDPITSGIESI